MSMSERVSVLYRIIDLQADMNDELKEIIERSHKQDELDVLRLQKLENRINVLREKVGAP